MSLASTTRTIKFIAKSGTYTALIMCPQGDLYQEWEGTEGDVSKVFPNFEETKPILNFVCTSSRVAEDVATPESMQYFFNGQKIEFSGDTSTGTFAGVFKKVAPSGDNVYYGLQILKNLVEISGYAPATIKMIATVSYATQSDQIQAVYTIPIMKSTGKSTRVTIAAGDDKSFVIREKGGSCILKALAFQSYEPLTKNLTYKWQKMSPNGWVDIEAQTAQTLTVSSSDVDTYGEFMVTVSRGGAEIGKDIQGVMDASDPYDIDPNPTPADETISEDETGSGQVVYTPNIVKRGTSEVAVPGAKFFFVVKDAAGVILSPEALGTTEPSTTCTVTRAMCIQGGGGDLSITITSED